MPAGAASRYALGDGGVGAARPAPAASLISASRYALGARRSAPRALRACVPGGAAAGCHRRLALRARRRWRGRCAPGRLWQPGRRLALRARRRRHGRCAPRGGAYMYMLSPPITARVASWWWGCRRRRALRAARELCARRALRAPAEGEGGEGWSRDHHARACGGTLVCCRSMCSASRRGAPLGSERLLPRPGRSPALSARVLQRFALQPCGHVVLRARRASRVRLNNGVPGRVPPRGGGLQDRRGK